MDFGGRLFGNLLRFVALLDLYGYLFGWLGDRFSDHLFGRSNNFTGITFLLDIDGGLSFDRLCLFNLRFNNLLAIRVLLNDRLFDLFAGFAGRHRFGIHRAFS